MLSATVSRTCKSRMWKQGKPGEMLLPASLSGSPLLDWFEQWLLIRVLRSDGTNCDSRCGRAEVCLMHFCLESTIWWGSGKAVIFAMYISCEEWETLGNVSWWVLVILLRTDMIIVIIFTKEETGTENSWLALGHTRSLEQNCWEESSALLVLCFSHKMIFPSDLSWAPVRGPAILLSEAWSAQLLCTE